MSWREAKARLWGNQPFTWVGHAYMTAGLPLLPTALVHWAGWWGPKGCESLGLWNQLTYLVLIAGMGVFYGLREKGDEERHRRVGDYDSGVQVITPRVDKIGDSFGPFLATFVATATLLAGLATPWPIFLMWLGATVALARAAYRIVRR